MVDGIIREITRGYWKPGDRLPTMAEFRKALGVGSSVPRTAMRTLSRMGVVDVRKHVGATVTGKGAHRWKGRIAFITTTARNSFYENVHAFALQSLFDRLDWDFVHITLPERQEDDAELDLAPLNRQISHGIDLAICFTGSRKVAAALDRAGVRYINEGGTGREFPNAEAVFNLELNSGDAARRLAEHWKRQGVGSVLVIDFEHVMPRIVTSALFAAGMKLRHIVVRRRDKSAGDMEIQLAGLNALQKFFAAASSRANPPDAIFFYDDYLAAGGLIALAATGLRVPEDLHVGTLANKGHGPVWFKPLTRLEYDPVGNAQLVCNYVVRILSGRGAKPPAIKFRFVEGAT